MKRYIYALLAGMAFSIAIVKGEAISWFRIQEMFWFENFHMYGLIGSAIIVGALSLFIIKKFKIKTIDGQDIKLEPKPFKPKANFIGGCLFGLGWAMTGSCPGPLYALLGYGHTIIIVSIIFAILGVFTYGVIKDKLPH
ncbi:MAG: putative membrane protein YedE/YeeE [Bacteroidia bacterium]|jgi:uncharacterized membrane protein YedE/YeeE